MCGRADRTGGTVGFPLATVFKELSAIPALPAA